MLNRRHVLSLAALSAAGTIGRRDANAAQSGDWRLVSSGGLATPRWDHTLSADSDRKRLILAFGRDMSGTPLGDSFVADRSTGEWEPIASPGPSARFGHAVDVDRDRGKLYLFGGQSGDQFFNDLWALDLESLEWELVDDGALAPSPRYGTSLVFDRGNGLIVSHGFTFEGRFDDTWRFDLDERAWTDISPDPSTRPLRRCLHEAIWNYATSSMWLYGGCSSGFGPCPQGDLWELRDGAWIARSSAGPAARSNPSLVLDGATGTLILCGGLAESGRVNDVWQGVFANGDVAWQQIDVPGGPSPRSSHDAVYSAGTIYLFGGMTDTGPADDLWRLKLPG
jgi:hypothetical protein